MVYIITRFKIEFPTETCQLETRSQNNILEEKNKEITKGEEI
jgi:hypothetical protein